MSPRNVPPCWATFLLGLVVTLAVLPSFGHSSVLFRKVPQEMYFIEQGRDIELPCITDRKDVSCIWMSNDTVKFQQPNRYQYDLNSAQGDCSLVIHNLTYPRDNAVWQCQVPTYSDLEPSFKWPKTTVVVLVKPSPPRFQKSNWDEQTIADKSATIVCESEGGNPLPSLEWHLNGENITANATTAVKGKSVISTLNYVFKKQNNASSLVCVSVHQLEKQSTKRVLNVRYRPIVSVAQKMYTVLEGHDLEIDCQVDANPPSSAFWKPNDNIPADLYKVNGSKLSFPKITGSKMDGKLFQCSSQNIFGQSEPVTISLSVLYPPRLIRTSSTYHEVTLGDELRLECSFTGNPKPTISWNFVDAIYSQEHSPEPEDPERLLIRNVSYTDEGDYYCQGTNENPIFNNRSIVRSQKMVVNVVGKPQFLNREEKVVGYQNSNTFIEQSFCSDPPPIRVEWLYDGSVQHTIDVNFQKKKDESKFFEIEEGIHIRAGPLMPLDPKSPKPTCFRSTLMVWNTDISDAKVFTIIVKNGETSIAEGIVSLQVYSKISGAMIISISLIALFLLFILTILFIFFLRRRSSGQQEDNGEEKSDARVPIHSSDDASKQASIEKNVDVQIYANIDFIGSDLLKSQQKAMKPKREPTLYAKISFDS